MMAERTASVCDDIAGLKARLGSDVCIAGHHYQCQAVVDFCDILGDSLELARKVKDVPARNIVFCGVYFMGESSALLAPEGQRIFVPSFDAECTMAKATPVEYVEAVLDVLHSLPKRFMPIAYVNSSLAVKSAVGRHGGAVCTSANAERMARWGLEHGDALFFLPDRNLGRNVGRMLGMAGSDMHVLDIRGGGAHIDRDAVMKASMVLWPGSCAVHQTIRPEHVEEARRTPGALVVAHPECKPSVIGRCDVSGSTAKLIAAVREAAPGTTLFVGTEGHLVDRLAVEAARRSVTVLPLHGCTCSNMAKVTPEALRDVLRGIRAGTARPVVIDRSRADGALLALNRMLDACR